MTQNRALTIKSWIKTMGFELTKSHLLEHKRKKVKYYTLGNFGIYEEITPSKSTTGKKLKFISWTPSGDHFEVNSVRDLSEAYQNYVSLDLN